MNREGIPSVEKIKPFFNNLIKGNEKIADEDIRLVHKIKNIFFNNS